ncbi:CLUMA_CG017251, isoform A [Clunio marinus]|uniref:CLUMA_CG017251, isoform A n=1 Tax=Clunio marinus TaxID=568069 RepID=A0A1J1IX58_9DIPT|nr:CLUMA_CG017251, isoform A [Clunio marinus]
MDSEAPLLALISQFEHYKLCERMTVRWQHWKIALLNDWKLPGKDKLWISDENHFELSLNIVTSEKRKEKLLKLICLT